MEDAAMMILDQFLLQPSFGMGTVWFADQMMARLHQNAEASWHNCTGAGMGTWEGQAGSTMPPPVWRAITTRGRAYLTFGQTHDAYLDLAHQALDYTLTRQEADGRFESRSTASPGSTIDDAFDTAECGLFLLEGYEHFRVPAHLKAGLRAARWLVTSPVTSVHCNPTYYAEHPTDPVLLQAVGFRNANFVGTMCRALAKAALYAEENAPFLGGMTTAITGLCSWQLPDGTWHYYGDYPDPAGPGADTTKSMVYHDLAAAGVIAGLETGLLSSDVKEYAIRTTIQAMSYVIGQQAVGGLVHQFPNTNPIMPVGAWTVANGLRVVGQHPVNQGRGSSFLFAFGRGLDAWTGTWTSTTKTGMDYRILILRAVTAIKRWWDWWERQIG
jgi:hypothetical protein